MSPDVKYLVMGSDGLFDVLPNKTISRRLAGHHPDPNPNPNPNKTISRCLAGPNPNPNP